MAEGKKSFVAYCDWENIFDMLSNEEAGLMVKHLFAYVNDKNPELEDRILKIAFEPIKLQLKRDLEKYKTIRERRSEAGRKGGEQTASKRTKQKQIKANEANATKCKQTVANQAVTVNVNDNDTVLSKDNKHDGVLKKTPSTLHSVCKNIFIEKFKSLFNDEYYWEAKDGANLNSIIKKIKFNRDKKGMSTDDDSVSVAFGLFLDSITDKWILENFSIPNINSKFNEIISQAKSGKNQLYATQKVSETEYKEF